MQLPEYIIDDIKQAFKYDKECRKLPLLDKEYILVIEPSQRSKRLFYCLYKCSIDSDINILFKRPLVYASESHTLIATANGCWNREIKENKDPGYYNKVLVILKKRDCVNSVVQGKQKEQIKAAC